MKWKLVCAFLWIFAVSIHAAEDTRNDFPIVWEIRDGLQAPESVYLDANSGFLFLSQIGDGGGGKKDGDGWISKLTTDGKFIKNKWTTGLNAPKGLRSHDGTLWVSDIDRLVAIDISTGRITKRVDIPNAKFLNDVACGEDGTVYVSDLVASRVYQYQNDEISVFAEGEQIEHPNGLLVHNGRLILGGWGKGLQEDFSTKIPGHLLAIELETKEQTVISDKPTGNLDGIEADRRGGFLVTDWRAGKVFHIDGKGRARLLMEFSRGVADHAFLADHNLLILPHMMENKLTAFDISSALR